ncbi:MAG TPA: YraN family protein [Thermodesulfobacteriota bacterium]
MTQARLARGRRGEALAAAYLAAAGYRIVDRNPRSGGGEIDLVAEAGGVVVFVEVRCRASTRFGGAAGSVTREKQARLTRAADGYLAARGWTERPARFDVVAVEGPLGAERITLIADAFEAVPLESAPRRWR